MTSKKLKCGVRPQGSRVFFFLVNQFELVCVERCPLTTRHTAVRSGNSCGNECRTHSQTELRRGCSPEAEAETRRSRADDCTIAGSRAEQSLTRGADRRLRYRPSRQRLQRRGPLRTVPGGGGIFLRVELGSPRQLATRERTCGEMNTWDSTWTAKSLT